MARTALFGRKIERLLLRSFLHPKAVVGNSLV
jgi:hypothetical protein